MVNIFISYSHEDKNLISSFIKQLFPLIKNNSINVWWDGENKAGSCFQDEIKKNLINADIICLMISKDFLSSNACSSEKKDALNLRRKKGTQVVPIILGECLWTEDNELKDILALPTDGKPISTYNTEDSGLLNVISGLKKSITSIENNREIKFTEQFTSYLNDAEILSKSHSNRDTLSLDEIFVWPPLDKCTNLEEKEKYNSDNIQEDILSFGKILLAGEKQSGRTTFCKRLCLIYKDLGFIPVYLSDENQYLGNPIEKLKKSIRQNYQNLNWADLDVSKVVPIVDNFHSAKYQQKYISEFSQFKHQIVVVDNIFKWSRRTEGLTKDYKEFSIREFSSIERNTLISKWIELKEKDQIDDNPNHFLKSLDEKTESIENSLGISFGKGIMDSYPFFILSLLSAFETQKSLDKDITSQGYCYQALIYLYFKKQGIDSQSYDSYLNFLTELAFKIFCTEGNGLTKEEFKIFIDDYKKEFSLPIKSKNIINVLTKNLIYYNSFNTLRFKYPYIYYFFSAKYFAENINEQKEVVNDILGNLHRDSNSYIAIFILHHSKENYILDELLINSEILFEQFKPATLKKEELNFFDEKQDLIIKAFLPEKNKTKSTRNRILKEKEEKEEKYSEDTYIDDDNSLQKELRRGIKTVEVLGMVIKNRSGSLKKERVEYIYEQGLKIHLRILTYYFEIIQNKDLEQIVISFLRERIEKINDNKNLKNKEVTEKKLKKIYWNLNFGVMYGCLTKAIHSLGSELLIDIAKSVYEKEKSPASYIVLKGIELWYKKVLDVNGLSKVLNNKNKEYSDIVKQILKHKIVEHCYMHDTTIQDKTEAARKLNIPIKSLLINKH